MKKYDTYKNSGIQWIGQVPEHWSVRKLKHIVSSIKSGGTPTSSNDSFYSEDGFPWVAIGDMSSSSYVLDTQKHITKAGVDDKGLTLYPVGTLLYSIYATIGKVSELRVPAYINQAILALVPKDDTYQQFLKYSLIAQEKYVYSLSNSNIQANLNAEIVSNLLCPLPPLTEQEAIANFLDKKTGEIDQAIALFEQEKTDLQAYRKAIISKTVTKGLNPNAKLKDSGIQWIGQIPEEWKTPKLSYITSKIGSGSTPRGGAETYVTSGVKFIRSQNVYDTGLRLEDVVCITDEVNESMKNSQVQVGDILYNITGGSIGRCYIVDDSLGPANVNQHVCIVRPCNVYGRFLLYNLQSEVSQYQLRILQSGGNREGLTAEAFKDFIIPLPPLSEQQAIADYLDKKTNDIDAALMQIDTQIADLQAYRTALISEAVTGKIDVRNQ